MSLAAPEPEDANPVRTRLVGSGGEADDRGATNDSGACRSGRTVEIRFTGFARCECRALTLYGPAPEEVVTAILRETVLSPRDLRVRGQQLGDVALLRRMPADVAPHLCPATIQPVAFVDGLSESELAGALAAAAAALN